MKSKNKTLRRLRRTAEQWQELVDEFDASELSAQEFCNRYDLGLSTLGKWRRRFGDSIRHEPATFVELPSHSVNHQVPSLTPLNSGFHVRLDLGSGVLLELTRS